MIYSITGFVLVIASCIIQIVFLFLRKTGKDIFSHYLLLAAAILLFITIVIRSIEMRFVAVTNMFESLVLFSAVILLVIFFFRMFFRHLPYPFVVLVGSIVALAMIAIASSPLAPKEVLPPVPALKSAWLVLHVIFAFIGEAFFALSFAAACYYLFVKDEEKKKRIERIVYTSIGIGYPVYTIGALIFGAVWAQVAWGNFWSWDQKEIWALVTCLVYTVYLHIRFIMKKKENLSIIIAIAGFLFTLFTLFGVNYLLSSLHSYL